LNYLHEWLFDDPPNVAVITTASILEGAVILYVSHDAEDGGWQFHIGEDINVDDAKVIALRRIVEIDNSVIQLADLPLGWFATRSSLDAIWQRHKHNEDA
jgi:hypothetical protein